MRLTTDGIPVAEAFSERREGRSGRRVRVRQSTCRVRVPLREDENTTKGEDDVNKNKNNRKERTETARHLSYFIIYTAAPIAILLIGS